MRIQIIRQILLWLITVNLLASCTSITKLFPKEPRPFQIKKFDSEQWKNGDYQTRGEMAEDLWGLIKNPKEEWKKSPEEVRQILGEPDFMTEAECCEARRGHSPQKLELWLYYLEIQENSYLPRKPGEPERPLIPQAFKLYFRKGDSRNFETMIGDRAGDHSKVWWVVGAVSGPGNFLMLL
jgi:hypothetical protein